MSADPPAHPRGPRMPRDARRAQVLQVARDLFSTEGFHHVSMDDIADRAEVSKPVLYRHFPSKLDLYLAVVDQRGADLLAAIDAAVSPLERGDLVPGNGHAIVTAVVRAYVDFVDDAGQSWTLLFESDVTRDTDVRARVEHAASEAARRIAAVLVEVTGLPARSANMLAASLTAMAQAAATHRFRSPGGPDAAQTAELVAQLAWRGVAGLLRPDLERDGST